MKVPAWLCCYCHAWCFFTLAESYKGLFLLFRNLQVLEMRFMTTTTSSPTTSWKDLLYIIKWKPNKIFKFLNSVKIWIWYPLQLEQSSQTNWPRHSNENNKDIKFSVTFQSRVKTWKPALTSYWAASPPFSQCEL